MFVVVKAYPTDTSYGVIIDAGSSGSRVRLYRWTPRLSHDKLPKFNEFFNKKKEPGISEFKKDNLMGLGPYLTELVDAAKERIPETAHGHTSIFLMATAGR
jgi:apyrase